MLVSILIAAAISVDSFSIGTAYGIKNIKIPLPSLLIINLMTLTALSLSMLMGHIISAFIPSYICDVISFLILFGIGSYMLTHTYIKKRQTNSEKALLFKFSIKPLGIVIQILKEPLKADFDISGTIDIKEAAFLGMALALDALGVGLGASMGSINYLSILIITGILNILFLKTGLYIGYRYKPANKDKAAYLPGLLLILTAVARVII